MRSLVTAGISRALRLALLAGSAIGTAVGTTALARAAQEMQEAETTDGVTVPEEELSEEELEARFEAEKAEFLSGIRLREGGIDLGSGLAHFDTGSDLRFIPSPDSTKILSDVWGNPPGHELGLIVPFPFDPFAEGGWAIVVDYEDEGHVDDDDAASIDYDDLLDSMRKGSKAENEARAEMGYPAIQVVGWAETPTYDSSAKTLYWAKELRFEGVDRNTLNYNLRVLGREGVLNLNVIGGMEELPAVKAATPDLLQRVRFQEGNRYEDFDESTDKMAAYGVTGLILGGVAAKTGLFKLLIGGILAAKKFLILAVVGLFAFFGRMFSGKKKTEAE